MKVSIITVVYNNKHCITDCIESVISQDYNDIEHIVIDGGSTDGTQMQIEKYRNHLSYYISEKDNGLYDAINKGIRQATGNIVGLLHSDDVFYDRNTIKDIVHVFQRESIDMLYANGLFVDQGNANKVKRLYISNPFRKEYLKFGWVPLHTTIYVKKEVFKEHGLYDINYKISSDYEMTLRWFKSQKLSTYFLKSYVVKMRLGGKSTSLHLQKKKSSEDIQIMKKYQLPFFVTIAFKIARKIPQYLLPKLLPDYIFATNIQIDNFFKALSMIKIFTPFYNLKIFHIRFNTLKNMIHIGTHLKTANTELGTINDLNHNRHYELLEEKDVVNVTDRFTSIDREL